MRERENLFNDYLEELRRKEKDEKHLKKEQVQKSISLLCQFLKHGWNSTQKHLN